MRALRASLLILALAVVGFVLVSGSPTENTLLLRIMTLAILAVSWNIMANAGLISLGHSAFWGLGSYITTGVASDLHWSFVLALIPAMAAGSVLGLALAVITGRLRGVFFAISTLALSEGLRVMALMLSGITGGAVGIYMAASAAPSPGYLHALAAGCTILVVLCAAWLATTRFQYASRALRNSEGAAQMVGIDPRQYRMLSIAISAAMAALAGGLNAGFTGYVDPDGAFSLDFTILPQIAVILGGLYSVEGPVLGAAAIVGLGELTRQTTGTRPGVSLLVNGILLVVCVLFFREGIWGTLQTAVRRIPGAVRLSSQSAPP